MNRRFLKTLCTLAAAVAPIATQADFPREIVTLGDSFTDSGNFPQVSVVTTPLIFSTGAPKTDGTTWAVWLADELKTNWLLPSSQAGNNFAVATAFTNGVSPFGVPSLTTQVTQIVPQVDRGYPVFVWGGLDEFFITGQAVTLPGILPASVAGNVGTVVQSINNLGFDRQIVLNMPNLAQFPFIYSGTFQTNNPNAATVQAMGEEYNSILVNNLAGKDFPVLGIDIRSLISDIIASPREYGFTNVTSAAPPVQVNGGGTVVVPGSPTDGYLFYYDGQHFTHKGQRTIADYIENILVAPSYYGNLSQQSFSVSREIMANIRQQSFAVQPCHESCALYPFISGSYEPLLNGPQNNGVQNYDGVGGDVTYGFTYDLGHTFRLGIAGSYARHYFENGRALSRSTTHLYTNAVSAFLDYQDCNFYLNGAFTTSWHNFDKIKRTFKVGYSTHDTNGHTHGIDYHGELTGAYLAFTPADNFATGPMFDFNYQFVTIDGYSESGATIGNLEYRSFSNNLFATGLGWEARYNFDYSCGCELLNITVDGYLMANRQWFGYTKDIKFREISFGDNFGVWPVVIAKRNNYISGGLSIAACVSERMTFNAGYTFNVGNLSMSEHMLTIGFNAPFNF